MTIPDLSDLSETEREYLYRLIARSDIQVAESTRQAANIANSRGGIHSEMSAPYRTRLVQNLQNRFNVLVGEISAGNTNNSEIKSEFLTLLKSLIRYRVVSPEEATQLAIDLCKLNKQKIKIVPYYKYHDVWQYHCQ